MNTKSKSKKGKEKGIIGTTLAAIMIASIFAAIAPVPVSAVGLTLDKVTYPDTGQSYRVGDLVNYTLLVGNPSGATYNFTVNVTDTFPNGTSVELESSITLAPGENWTQTYMGIYVVTPSDAANTTIVNKLSVYGYNENPTPELVEGIVTKISDVITEKLELYFSWEQICCRNLNFTGWASDNASSDNFTWTFDGVVVPGTGPLPNTTNYTFATCGPLHIVNFSACNATLGCNYTNEVVYVDCGPTAIASANPYCFDANGSYVTFNGSKSQGDLINPDGPRAITWWKWTFDDGEGALGNDTAVATRWVNDTVTATLEVSDGCCNSTTNLTVNPCSECKLRIYGTFDEGPGNLTAKDPETGLKPENPPYTDPLGPFHPQNKEAPRKDFITFNPAIMDHNQGYPELDYVVCPAFGSKPVQTPKEKVFKRMWYEKEWFKDSNTTGGNGEWDVVIEKFDTTQTPPVWVYSHTMSLGDWNAMPAWEKEELGLRIREWNSPYAPPGYPAYIPTADIYGPAIKQEFTYMFLDDNTMPIMVRNGSEVFIPMAHDPANSYRGLNSFDADGDGVRDTVRVESEQTLGMDIDHDGLPLEPIDKDAVELNGNEQVVLVLGDKYMTPGDTIQFFDHRVTLEDVFDAGFPVGAQARFTVCDNEGGGSQRCSPNVMLTLVNDIAYFYRAEAGGAGEREAFYLRITGVDIGNNLAIVEVGRMFGQTHANIEANAFRSQKMFIVDEVFYNVVAIKAFDNCIKYITFRQKLPKMPIKLFGKDLKVWEPEEVLPEMSPFNMGHEVLVDVWDTQTYPIEKIGPKEPREPLEIVYTEEDIEERYKGELKEIYNETVDHDEYWNLEWFWMLPWQYTEFRLPPGDKYLVTLSWIAPESEITLWDGVPDPVANYTGERFKFWYQDCSGPLYIDANQSSIRIYGTFDEGPGNLTATDPITGLRPENPPYTDPVGPFHPQNKEAPRKDFMTLNPAIMDHNQGYEELDFVKCLGCIVQTPKEKVFKRMWYEKEWFKDSNTTGGNGEWDVVIEKYDRTQVPPKWVYNRTMTLTEWNAIPDYVKVIEELRIREWNSPYAPPSYPEYIPTADIYGPAIKQEFTYMFLDENTMPIMVRYGSEILIPMAHDPANSYRGLNSFDADGDGARDTVRVESEQTLGRDIDQDGLPLEPIDKDAVELNGNEQVVLVLGDKYMTTTAPSNTLQFFDHEVTLKNVFDAGFPVGAQAIFDVCDNEGGGSQRCSNNVQLTLANPVAYFYRAEAGGAGENTSFYLRLIAIDIEDDIAIVEVGRMFGQTHANIEANAFRSQKMFIVDEVFYNVVAIKAFDNCIKYITFRQKLPKMPIKLFGKDLKVWEAGETLPEMSPFNMNHEIIIDVQNTWTRPYSQQDKIGPKEPRGALNITYVEEDVEERFTGELREIYNETLNATGWIEDEYWNVEWFHTQPDQYTAFVMPNDQLYLMTLAWYAPESEITLWDSDPNGPVLNYTGERVKFWYDATDNTDIYVNRVGEDGAVPPPWMSNMTLYYDRPSEGGNGNGQPDIDEVINAIMDYLTDTYPFGPTGPGAPFDKAGLIQYILAYLAMP